MPLEQRIGYLSLMAFERMDFIKRIKNLKEQFREEFKQVKVEALLKAQKVLRIVQDQMAEVFHHELDTIIKKFNLTIAQNHEVESKLKTLQQEYTYLERLNIEKDRLYDLVPVRYLHLMEDLEFKPEQLLDVNEETINKHNMLMHRAFAHYGSFTQMSANFKDDFNSQEIYIQLLQKIQDLEKETKHKDMLLEANETII